MKIWIKKHRLLFLLELFLVIIALSGCFRGERKILELSGGAVADAVMQEEDKNVLISDSLKLTPGVYQVRAAFAVPEKASLLLRVESGTTTYKALRSNEVTIFSGQMETEFEVYVLDDIEEAYIRCDFVEAEASAITSLSFYKTSIGSRIFCFWVIIGCIFINLMISFRCKILEGRVSRERQTAFWILLLCVALAYFPYATDYMNLGADAMFHLNRIEGLKDTLLEGGQFPLRVQSRFLYGHGYANSTFYGDFFILIPALLRIIGFSLMSSYKMFVLLVMLATAVLSFISFYKITKDTYGALFGSVIYMLAPYRIYNVYNRCAVGEYLAMVFLPLVCCGMVQIFTQDIHAKEYSRAKIWIIVGLTGILQSHILSTEITGVLILLVCLVLWKKTLRRETFLQLSQAAVLTLLLNCWFWLPLVQMMAQEQYVLQQLVSNNIQDMGTWFAGLFQLVPFMGAAQTGMYNAEPIQIGPASLLLLSAFVILICRRRRLRGKEETSSNTDGKTLLFLLVMIIVVVFMSTRYFPWNFLAGIPGVKFFVTALQFPTRFLSSASALCALFATLFVPWFRKECMKPVELRPGGEDFYKGSILFLSAIAVFSAVYHVNDIAFEQEPVYLYAAENMGTIGVGSAEYLLDGTTVGEYHYHGPLAEEGLEWTDYHKNGLNISIHISNFGTAQRYLELPVTGYRGYRIKCTDAQGEIPQITEERGAHGDLRLAVPAGFDGTVRIWYGGLTSFRLAELVSLVSLCGLLMYCLVKKCRAVSAGLHLKEIKWNPKEK